MTPLDARLLAALLLADGRPVPYTALPGRYQLLGEHGGPQRAHMARRQMRRRGLGVCVEWGRFACRMVALPPDWALEDVLACARELRGAEGSQRRSA